MIEETRKYGFPDADLMMLASKLVLNMTRDSVEFALRGVDAAAVTTFEAIGDAFEVLPPDAVYVGDLKIATAAKTALRDSLTVQVQALSGYVEQKWGPQSGQYSSMMVKGMHKISDAKFLLMTRNVVARATVYLAELTSIGLTQAMIDAMETDGQSLEDALIDVINKKEIRDIKATERTEKGNELYGFATDYSKIGKLIWENVDMAKYNDYVIYVASHGGMGKVKSLAYDVPTRTVSWESLQTAVGYQLEFKENSVGAEWAVAFEGVETSIVDDPGAGSWYYRCRGHNAEGYGDWSDELDVLLPN